MVQDYHLMDYSKYSVAMMSGELFEIDALDLKVNRVLNLEKR